VSAFVINPYSFGIAGEIVFETDFQLATQSVLGAPIVHNGYVAPNFSVSDFTGGGGIQAFRLDSSSNEGVDYWISEVAGSNLASTLQQAVDLNCFFTFAITAPAGKQLTGIEFAMRGFASNQIGFITLRSDIDNYTADLATASRAMNGKQSVSIVLPSQTNNVTNFRFYVYDLFEGQNSRRIGIDDVKAFAIL
jgi:hypothetical protein